MNVWEPRDIEQRRRGETGWGGTGMGAGDKDGWRGIGMGRDEEG